MILETHKIDLDQLAGDDGIAAAIRAKYTANPSLNTNGVPSVPVAGAFYYEEEQADKSIKRLLIVIFQKLA